MMEQEIRQIQNPFLPLDEYIPDGEPHVFGDRLYLFGSHDKEGGDTFCMLDYVVYSAPIDDLTDWRCEGTTYKVSQDPEHSERNKYMYAPDVVMGQDGRYYLYYFMAGGRFNSNIRVAVCDTPAGQYEFYGYVRNPDGTSYNRCITFDPAVLNDDGDIWLYYGWSLAVDESMVPGANTAEVAAAMKDKLLQVQVQMFEKTEEEILAEPNGIMGANVVKLAPDMLTVMTEPSRIVPGQFSAAGTSFEGHAFFEGSSIRKINGVYYFIYSSQLNHELCYATSRYPDRDFTYGGTIVSNGDVGYQGREAADRLNTTGNNHGSIELVEGQWYVFYHRQTHKSLYSRQACAERITILPDGSIPQVETTTQGLSGTPLRAEGNYAAAIACNLTNGHMPHLMDGVWPDPIPHITHADDRRFTTEIQDGTTIGYKYFAFHGPTRLSLRLRGDAEGTMQVLAGEKILAEIAITPSDRWHDVDACIEENGDQPLYFRYFGQGMLDMESFTFER